MLERRFELPDENATVALAKQVALGLGREGLVIYLHGPLGAGKSSFSRALLQSLGVTERIKSPTYSLVESYPWRYGTAWHLDLYRISDPSELEWLGLEALSDAGALVLAEWPERGSGWLRPADLELYLDYAGEGRVARLLALKPAGEWLLQHWPQS